MVGQGQCTEGFRHRLHLRHQIHDILPRAPGTDVPSLNISEEDIKNYFFRAARCQRIQGGLDPQGQRWSAGLTR